MPVIRRVYNEPSSVGHEMDVGASFTWTKGKKFQDLLNPQNYVIKC